MSVYRESGKIPQRFCGWGPPAKGLREGIVRRGLLAAVAVVLLALFLLLSSIPDGLLALPIGLVLVFIFVKLMANAEVSPSQVEALMDLPGAVSQYPVRIKLFVKERSPRLKTSSVSIGSDLGVLSFVDGNIVFQGVRSYFALDNQSVDAKLAGCDLSGVYSESFGFPRLYSLSWTSDPFQGGVEIRLFQTSANQGSDLLSRFSRDYEEWLAHKRTGQTQLVYPPVTPSPDSVVQARKEVVIGAFLLVLAFAASASLDSLPAYCRLPAICVWFAVCAYAWRAGRHWRAVRRAARRERRFMEANPKTEVPPPSEIALAETLRNDGQSESRPALDHV